MNMKDNKRPVVSFVEPRIWFGIVFGICLIIAVYLVGRRVRPVQIDGGYCEVMGTFARIVVVADNTQKAKNCIEAGFEELRRIDRRTSRERISLLYRYRHPVGAPEDNTSG